MILPQKVFRQPFALEAKLFGKIYPVRIDDKFGVLNQDIISTGSGKELRSNWNQVQKKKSSKDDKKLE